MNLRDYLEDRDISRSYDGGALEKEKKGKSWRWAKDEGNNQAKKVEDFAKPMNLRDYLEDRDISRSYDGGALEKEKKGKSWRWAKDEGNNQAKKVEDFAKPREGRVSLRKLYSFADTFDCGLMLIGSIGAIGHGIALPLILVFLGGLLNGIGSANKVQQTTDKYALYFVYMSCVCFVSAWLEVAFWMQSGHRQSARLRTKYLQAVLRQDVALFDTKTNTGDILNSIAVDSLAVQDAISEKTGHFLHHVVTFFASFIVSFYSLWRIAVVTLAVIPCIALSGGLYAYYLNRFTTQAQSAYTEAGSIAHQAISQVRNVQSFVIEDKFAKSYSNALQTTLNLSVKSAFVKGMGLGITVFILLSCYGLCLYYGGIIVSNGLANGGDIIATIFNIVVGSSSLVLAMSNITPFQKAQASAYKLFEVIHREPSINKPDKSAVIPNTVEGHIQLRNVDFSYPSRPDFPVFQKFSLVIPPGRSVAIVGSSGSGKSTVISLIERFYDPTAGEVLLDGLDLRKIELKWLRRQIGLVNQEPALFATTIAANIAYGNDNASEKDIEEAAKVANAHTFIGALPDGYQTQVGERGVQLSGGQRQRIAIARAIVRNPRVLLLDEATSALDSGSELLVQEALDRIMLGRTTVVVAHRLSTIRNAGSIAVVEKGCIVENGTHQDLISREDGAYFALVRLQEQTITSEGGHESCRDSDTSYYSPIAGTSKHGDSPHEPKQQEKVVKASKGGMHDVIAMTKDDWRYVMTAMIGSIGAGWISPLVAWILAGVVADFYNPDKQYMRKDVSRNSLRLVGLGVFCIIVYNLQHFALGVLGERLVNRVREKLFAKILRNELGWFEEDANNSSQLATCLASDATTVRTAVVDRTNIIVGTISLTFLSFAICFVIQWKLAFVMLVAFPTITCGALFEQVLLGKFAKEQAKAYERASQLAGEAVGNIRTVAAFSAEEKVEVLLKNELGGLRKKSFRNGHVVGFGYGISQFLLYSSVGLGLWYAGKLVASGQSTFATILKVFLIVVFCSFTSAEAFSLTPDLVKGTQAVASLFHIMNRETKIDPDSPKGEKTQKINGDVELKGVTFAYPTRPDLIVLKNVNLRVKFGRSLALVGASGCGKSSIIALIERFYDPLFGEILIDGKDIKAYNLQFIRRHIALVQQEPALFATTIYENILYGKEGASQAEVIEAAKAANAHKFISSLPEGYETQVGERGVQLSGGQKQRVAIARAVLKDPTILLLDEAASALDAESEKVVQEAIDKLMVKGKTTILVAHRLSTIQGADSIAVVQDGSVVERGSHATLLGIGGVYSQLVRLQNHTREP